jgi:hypothetical protein
MPDRSRFFFFFCQQAFYTMGTTWIFPWGRAECTLTPLFHLLPKLSIWVYLHSYIYICLHDLMFKHRNCFTLVSCMLNFSVRRLIHEFKFYKITFMNENYFNEWRESVINTLKPDSHTLFAEEITAKYACIESRNVYGIEFLYVFSCIWHQMSDTSELGGGRYHRG